MTENMKSREKEIVERVKTMVQIILDVETIKEVYNQTLLAAFGNGYSRHS